MIECDEIETVEGLYYVDAVNIDTRHYVENLDNLKWVKLSNSKNSRMVQHYGYRYDYKNYNIYEPCNEIPEFLNELKELITFICREINIIDDKYVFNQCIINNYHENQGISPHTDVLQYGSVIACFTLNSGSVMTFTKNNETYEIYVKPNSLYIMSGDARYVWKHAMNIKKYDTINDVKIPRGRRISITFRNVPIKKLK